MQDTTNPVASSGGHPPRRAALFVVGALLVAAGGFAAGVLVRRSGGDVRPASADLTRPGTPEEFIGRWALDPDATIAEVDREMEGVDVGDRDLFEAAERERSALRSASLELVVSADHKATINASGLPNDLLGSHSEGTWDLRPDPKRGVLVIRLAGPAEGGSGSIRRGRLREDGAAMLFSSSWKRTGGFARDFVLRRAR